MASKHLEHIKDNLYQVRLAIESTQIMIRVLQSNYKDNCITDENFDDYADFYCMLRRLDNRLDRVINDQYAEAEKELERLIENA